MIYRRLGDDGNVEKISVKKLFGDKKGVLVGVPGAFTPTCSNVHLPEYVEKSEDLAAKVGTPVSSSLLRPSTCPPNHKTCVRNAELCDILSVREARLCMFPAYPAEFGTKQESPHSTAATVRSPDSRPPAPVPQQHHLSLLGWRNAAPRTVLAVAGRGAGVLRFCERPVCHEGVGGEPEVGRQGADALGRQRRPVRVGEEFSKIFLPLTGPLITFRENKFSRYAAGVQSDSASTRPTPR